MINENPIYLRRQMLNSLVADNFEGALSIAGELVSQYDRVKDYRWRGCIFLALGEERSALDDLRTVLQNLPDDPASMCYVAMILAASHISELRNGLEAMRIFRHAWEVSAITDSRHLRGRFLTVGAAAQAELGRFDKAIKFAAAAIPLLEAHLADRVSKRIEEYRQGRPYRIDYNFLRRGISGIDSSCDVCGAAAPVKDWHTLAKCCPNCVSDDRLRADELDGRLTDHSHVHRTL